MWENVLQIALAGGILSVALLLARLRMPRPRFLAMLVLGLHWVALGIAFVAGTYLYSSSWARGASTLWGLFGVGWLFAIIGSIVLIARGVLDVLADMRPDRQAILAMALVPVMLVAGIHALPHAWQQSVSHVTSWSTDAQSSVTNGKR